MGRPRTIPARTPYDAALILFRGNYHWNPADRHYYRRGSLAGPIAGKTLGHTIRQFLADQPGPFLHKTALDRLVEQTLEQIREE